MNSNLPVLITASELNALFGDDGDEGNSSFDERFRIIESHFGQNGLSEYSKGHIEKAIYLDMLHGIVPNELYPFDIPEAPKFEEYLGSLGINNKHHIIIYDRSDNGFNFTPRMWSLLRFFGHEDISILKGGFNSWKANGYKISSENPSFKAEKFEINVNNDLHRDYDQIKKNLKTQKEILVDARPAPEFNKLVDEKINHIPNAKNLPFAVLFNENGFKSREELENVMRENGIDLRNKLVTSCNSGVKACVLQLAFYLVGLKTVAVYYGSWTEYSKRDAEDSKYNFKKFGPEETQSESKSSSSICSLI